MPAAIEVALDLPNRFEYRYLLSDAAGFIARGGLDRVRYSDFDWAETIYLDTKKMAMPGDRSIRLRRYLPGPCEPDANDGEYFIDIKQGDEDSQAKIKRRLRGDLKAARRLGREAFGVRGLKPVLAITYKRAHFTLGIEPVRVTVDEQIVYWGFPARPIGRDAFQRVEIKESRFGAAEGLHELLFSAGGIPAMSKKRTGYRFLKMARKNVGNA